MSSEQFKTKVKTYSDFDKDKHYFVFAEIDSEDSIAYSRFLAVYKPQLSIVNINVENKKEDYEKALYLIGKFSYPLLPKIFEEKGPSASGKRAFATKFVPSIQLYTLIETLKKQGKTLPPSALATIAFSLCNALYILHKNNIAHRNISPFSISIDSDFYAHIGLEFASTRSGTYNTGGSTNFLAPEAKPKIDKDGTAKAELSSKSDVFSFGGILFYLLTNSFPFEEIDPSKDPLNDYTSKFRLDPRFEDAKQRKNLFPKNADKLISLIKRCWDFDISSRPSTESISLNDEHGLAAAIKEIFKNYGEEVPILEEEFEDVISSLELPAGYEKESNEAFEDESWKIEECARAIEYGFANTKKNDINEKAMKAIKEYLEEIEVYSPKNKLDFEASIISDDPDINVLLPPCEEEEEEGANAGEE